jgi:hypothetical protein
VQAQNGCGTTNAPGVTGSRLAAPSAPTSVSATTDDCAKVTVTFTDGTGAASHDVLRYDGACPSGAGLVTFGSVTSPFEDATAVAGASYCYVVRARNGCGTTDASAVTGTRLGAIPMSPVDLARSGNDLVLAWAVVPGAASYNVYRSTDPASGFGAPVASLPGSATGWTDAGEAGNPDSVYYSVTDVNGCGVESAP